MTHIYLLQRRSDIRDDAFVVVGAFRTLEDARDAADAHDTSGAYNFYISVCEIGAFNLPRLVYVMASAA